MYKYGLLATSSHSTCCRLDSVSLFLLWFAYDLDSFCSSWTCLRLNLCCFGLLRTSTRSARRSLVSISTFHALCCSTPRVTLLILDLSPSQSLPLWFAQHLELICSSLTCLHCFKLSCFALIPRLDLLAVQLSLAAI